MGNHVEAWLYTDEEASCIAAYGLVREASGEWWNSIGVHPSYQGRGLGSFITHDVLQRHDGPVSAIVRRDNPAALAMHHDADWEIVEGPEPELLVHFRSKGAR